MKDKSVAHSSPPIHSQNAGMAISKAKPSRQSGPWKRGGIRSFMGLAGGGDAGRNAELVIMGSVVVVVPVVNQPVARGKSVTLSKANENHAPTICFRSCQDFMASVMGVGNSSDPFGRRADSCNGNESSGADPSDVGE